MIVLTVGVFLILSGLGLAWLRDSQWKRLDDPQPDRRNKGYRYE